MFALPADMWYTKRYKLVFSFSKWSYLQSRMAPCNGGPCGLFFAPTFFCLTPSLSIVMLISVAFPAKPKNA